MLDIQEANPVLVQSGVFMIMHNTFTVNANEYAAQGLTTTSRQTYRDYTFNSSNAPGSGDNPFVHRCDTGTGWVLQRGSNRLAIKHAAQSPNHRGFQRGYAIVNYTATAPADVETINHPVHFFGNPYTVDPGLGLVSNYTLVQSGIMRVPKLGTPYRISGVILETVTRYFGNQFTLTFLGINPGEWDGTGFIGGQPVPAGSSLYTACRSFLAFTRAFNADSLHTGKLDVEQERIIARQFDNINTIEVVAAWGWWITYHQMTFSVAGVVTVDGSPVGAGKTVNVYAYVASPGPEDVTEFVTSTTTAMDGTGSFTVNVLDSTRTYFASYVNDGSIGRSADGTPGTSTFNIVIGAAGRRFIGSPFVRRLR